MGRLMLTAAGLILTSGAFLGAGCTARGNTDAAAGAPPPAAVERDGEGGVIRVDHPDQFPLATATSRDARPELSVTGVVSPDVSRAIPVVSLTSGRVIDLRARLGDVVKKGQVLLRVQSADISSAFSDYRKALADQALARSQLDRANALFERGAIAKKDAEVAQDAADKARVDVENATERLHVLGMDANRAPTAIVDIVAPESGVITEQNVTNAAGVKSLDNAPNLFTISDLSRVWIVCDVYENDLPTVRIGDTAEIHLNAYPDRAMTGRISNIGSILDPTIRTAKVRIEVANPGLMRIGMFATATFRGQTTETRAVVPATAILHLHDREWAYIPVGDGRFERRAVVAGQMLPGNMQEIVSGLKPGERVVSNALVFQNTVEQ
ncbi:MAG TPA: efflux RND transporter periplasmic adaptor subunit [Vicinamibacterales bacterium]|nr:efflux RND transporter periplasmic adaptor subunit [Vicinamibacterales bacterium]